MLLLQVIPQKIPTFFFPRKKSFCITFALKRVNKVAWYLAQNVITDVMVKYVPKIRRKKLALYKCLWIIFLIINTT